MVSFSVIIPNRNNPDLLRRALGSVPIREDLEVIVVDDASDPTKIDFQDYPGTGRPGTTVVLGEGGKGAGHARNVGLSRARGRWLIFLDSDDFFTPDLPAALDRYSGSDADVIYFDIASADSDTLLPSPRHEDRSSMFAKYRYKPEKLDFYCRYIYSEPWGKLIRRELVESNSIRFDETLCANDYMFTALTGLSARKTLFDPAVIYCVTQRQGSLSSDYFSSPAMLAARLDVYCRVDRLFRRNSIPLFPFSGLWMMCRKKGEQSRRAADEFCKANGISRISVLYDCLRRIVRKHLRIGVPYCN